MTKCPFCFTELDGRATVCHGCQAKKGFGYHSSYGLLTEQIVRRRMTKMRVALVGVAALSVAIAFAAHMASIEGPDAGGPSPAWGVLMFGCLVAAIPAVGIALWKRRLARGATWWK